LLTRTDIIAVDILDIVDIIEEEELKHIVDYIAYRFIA